MRWLAGLKGLKFELSGPGRRNWSMKMAQGDTPGEVRSNEGLCASTVTTGAAMPRGTSAEILRAMQKVMAELGPEPIGQWMRERGYNPEEWLLWLPASYKEQGPALWPSYVMFSSLIEKPLFMRRGAVFGA